MSLVLKSLSLQREPLPRDRGKHLFEGMLSHIIAQMDAESLEVVYPAPIADGFNAPAIEEQGSAMYRIVQPAALSETMTSPAFNSIPNLLHNQPEPLAQGIQSHHIFWYRWILRSTLPLKSSDPQVSGSIHSNQKWGPIHLHFE